VLFARLGSCLGCGVDHPPSSPLTEHPLSAQAYCPPEHLAWSSRWPRIQSELNAYDADLLFLQVGAPFWASTAAVGGGAAEGRGVAPETERERGQHALKARRIPHTINPPKPNRPPHLSARAAQQEVEQPVFDQQLKPWLDPTHESLFNPRRLLPGVPGPEEGVTLHFKRAAFELIDSHAFRLADLAAAVLPAGADHDPRAYPLMRVVRRREENAVAALLQHRASGRQLVAASTHLFWDPAYPDVKVAQAAALCRGIVEFVERRLGRGAARGVPVVIGGE